MSRSDDRADAGSDFDALQYDDEFGETAARLGLAVAPVQPSATMKADIMTRIAVTPQLPAQTALSRPVIELETDSALAPAPTTGRAERAARERWFQRPGSLIAAAAAAVVLFAAGVLAGGAMAPTGADEQQLAAIVASSDVRTTPAEVTGGGSTTLVSSESLEVSALVFENLPALTSDEAYALWYIDAAGTADAAGLFSADSEGTVIAVLEGAFTPGTVVGVSVEPAGGSPAPTTQPIVVIATEA